MAESRLGRRISIFLVAVLVVVLDQASKAWIQRSFYLGESRPEEGFFRLTYITNKGAAFGLFPDQSFVLIFIAVAVIGAVFVYYRYLPFDGSLFLLSLGLQLGGAVGNLLDRLRLGYVVDFIDVRFWYVFNLADSAIVVGVVTLAYFILVSGKAQNTARQDVTSRPD